MLLHEPHPTYPSNLRALMPSASVERAAAVVLAALFLPGGPRGFAPPRRRWPEMLHALRAEGVSLASCAWALRRWGFTEESLVLESPGLLSWAEGRLEAGEVLTAACPRYPIGWRRKLGAGAPPAVWLRGTMPEGPFLAVVGSRSVGSPVRHFAREVGAAAVRLGYAVASGAASGCDRAAAEGAVGGRWEKTKNEKRKTDEFDPHPSANGQRPIAQDPANPKFKIQDPKSESLSAIGQRRTAYESVNPKSKIQNPKLEGDGRWAMSDPRPSNPKSKIQNPKWDANPESPPPLVEILPCGPSLRREAFDGAVLSPFEPKEPFSGPSAMIRNALIYAMAEVAMVVHSRFGEGGTWRGATEAHRRRLCRLIVHPGFDPVSRRAAQALAALGAHRLDLDLNVEAALSEALSAADFGSETTLPF